MPSKTSKTKSPELIRLDESIEGDKRQAFPYQLRWECKGCGAPCEIDFAEGHYLSYPDMPGEASLTLYCNECGRGEEQVALRTNITLEIVED